MDEQNDQHQVSQKMEQDSLSNEQRHDARENRAELTCGAVGEKLVSASAKRRERIRQLEARLERERSRENAACRKERNGQLFVWGAMVEGVYRSGNDAERNQIRQWAAKHLTDKRHHHRAELGFIRIDEEAHGDEADAYPTA